MNVCQKVTKLLSLLIVVICFVSLKVEEVQASGADFGVEPIYSEHQDKDKKGYFSLVLKENQKETLKVKVTNYSKEPTTIFMLSQQATTANSGVIEYNDVEKKVEPSAPANFKDIVVPKSEKIELKPEESKEIDVDVVMPSTNFEGLLLGGLYFSQQDKATENPSLIKNTFSYTLPVALKMSDKKIENQLVYQGIELSNRNSSPYIEAKLLNEAASLIKELSVEGRIFDKKTGEEFYVSKMNELEMAPNSVFKFGFDLRNSAFIPGDYLLKLDVVADGKDYHFEDDFTIDKETARKLNDASVYVQTSGFPWLIVIGIVSLVAMLSVIGILLKRQKKKDMKKRTRKVKRKTKK
ncbi:MAG: DUF916 and DUF3324 domain-containing protein [Vagococcus sp.]